MSNEVHPGPSRAALSILSIPRMSRRCTLRGEARRIINNIVECCEQECERKYLFQPLTQSANRTATYTGASISTVRRIRKFCIENPGKLPETPGKKRPKATGRIQWNEFHRSVVKQTIEDFYLVQKIAPSLRKLRPILKEKIGWTWSVTSLRNTLLSMGFIWKDRQYKRRLLLERSDIAGWRSHFIVQMRHSRAAAKEIFYVDETWIDSNLVVGKCWPKNAAAGVPGWGTSSKRLIVGSVGSRKGFIREAQLNFWANSAKGDYRGQMTSEIFEKWFETMVLPNLPPNAVIVINNAPYQNRQVDKTPTCYHTKMRMLQWLQKRQVPCSESMRKQVLFSLIQEHCPSEKSFVIDKMAKEKGHLVVRLPPHNCNLSAMELAWAKVKRLFRELSVTGDLLNDDLLQLVSETLLLVTADDWEGYCTNKQQLEEDYWRRDAVVEHAIEDIMINTAESDSSDDNKDLCTDDEYNESDSD
ncbi:uncharacterized protein LOC124550863 [Schistocerca americana]|uniref:uncharacterized protein LOC124550863 n=1 Tax=Schistocerca americana TaxID=7009 RepID=UPI001F502194|nr:uncharacterized protein LOC124550863 [Schistocerca americana]XP_047099515.1 uncharacterized protein LOC124716961 [Schistocerca piceifrons]